MSENKKLKTEKRVSIGGQAVLEGVYMRGAKSEATAVRDADGVIRLETKRRDFAHKNPFLKLPIIRGVVAFIDSLFGGTKTLMRSAEVYGETEKPNAFETWLSEKLKIDAMSVISFVSVLLGVVFAVGLFIFAPQYVRILIETLIGGGFTFGILERNLIEGGVKVLIFISYLLLVGLIKDVRRTFMYHGAEHKTISCYEKGLTLTPENAMKCSRLHSRCGTTFTFIVVIVSIIMIIYLKKTKHGYELSVVGASVNTAKYVGINVRKVIIRTMILSGAICGLVGFLLVSGHHHTLSANLAGGRGFTGVLIAWLGKFEPGAMILYAVLVAIFQRGSTKAASYVGINKSEFSAIVTGIFFLIVIATEFFANYKILFDEESKTKHLIDKFLGLFKKKEKIEQVPEQTNESKEDK